MAKILGIDLGTTNSAMAIAEGGQPKILENREGNNTTPSVIAVNKSGERLVGTLARRQSITNPKNTLYSVKRLIGRKWTDKEVQGDKKWLSYEIKEAANGGVDIQMGDKWYKPEEISAMVLSKLKADAEAKLGETITEAIITVPAYFDDSQRQATKNAGEIAGLKVLRIINEPTAAALAYGLDRNKNEKIVIYDLGGGTFDVSVLEIADNTVEVKSTGGDTHLGGDDFDKKINEYLVNEYLKLEGVDLSHDPLAMQRLREAGEKAKHELSTATETEINLPYITSDSTGPKHFSTKLSRAKLENLVQEYIDHSISITKQVVKDANLDFKDINEVVLVGGQTRMPAVVEAVKAAFGKEPHRNINPDEVVALGAAVQAGVLQGDVKDLLLLDVTPLSLGIETLGGVMTPLIEKNTTIPTSKSQVFSTAGDNQTQVQIHVLQGERPMAADNKTLGMFNLDGIPPAPRGVPQVEVSFDIDANGILNVKAIDKASGKAQSITIQASSNLNKEEIEKLKAEAARFAEEDKKKRELIDLRNQSESLIYTTEKTLKDFEAKISDADKTSLKEKIEALKSAQGSTEANTIKSAHDTLSSELQRIGGSLYGQPGQESTGSTEEPPKSE